MSGGLLQLVFVGQQNKFFTTCPQITLFKAVYYHYSNFAIEPIELFSTEKNIKNGAKFRIKIDKIGDLVNTMMVKINLNKNTPIDRLSLFIFKSVKIEIGGIVMDTHYSEWHDIYYELYRKQDYLDIKNFPTTLYLPLRFWFNNYIGLSLPLVSLQYQDVYLLFEVNELCVDIFSVSVICDYIFLDIDQRKKFATQNHTYLVETIETFTDNVYAGLNTYRLPFTSTVKELYWVISDYTLNKKNPLLRARILFNGQERTRYLDGNYYNYAQPYAHHRCIPKDGVNVYSFSIYPGAYQVSGFANFPNFNVTLDLEYDKIKNSKISIFASSYKLFCVSHGFSNLKQL